MPALVTAAPVLLLEGDAEGAAFRRPGSELLPAALGDGRRMPVRTALDRLVHATPGRWFGFLGYELGWAFDELPAAAVPPRDEARDLPDLHLAAHDWWIEWREGPGGPRPVLVSAPIAGLGDDSHEARLRDVLERVRAVRSRSGPLASAPSPSGSGVRTSLPRDRFMEGVRELRRRIRAGDIFQANLTHLIEGHWAGTHLDFHRALREASPAPWSAWIEVDEGRSVSSISPEGFLEVEGRRVRTSPIKGTAPRAADPEEDRRLAASLRASEKDRAENLMIADLLRNDLSRVAEPGTVRMGRRAELESHPSVHHLVSDVEARLARGRALPDLLAATFPGGSITGAPKLRAMELLAELEPHRRGVYTGALGWMDADGGRARFSVAIRTAALVGARVAYGTGGGITLASDPGAEWTETLDKARAFLRVLGAGAEALEGAT